MSSDRRDYDGYTHRALRAQWRRIIDDQGGTCCRCGGRIEVRAAFDLDHADDRRTYLGPAHPHCNRAAGARNGATLRAAANVMIIREWDD